MNIFAELIHSVRDFKSYAIFVKERALKVFLYGMMVSLIYILLAEVVPMAVLLAPTGGIDHLIQESMPEFTLEDDTLWVAEPVEYKQYDNLQGGVYVKIDTESDITEQMSDVDLLPYENAIVLDAHNIMVKSGGEVLRGTYAELDLGDWDKESVVREIVPLISMFVWFVVILAILLIPAGFFLGALFTTFLGLIVNSILKYHLSFRELFKMSVHARTASMLLKIILAWAPVTIPYFFVINFGLSVFYIWKGIQYMKWEEEEQRRVSQSSGWTGEF